VVPRSPWSCLWLGRPHCNQDGRRARGLAAVCADSALRATQAALDVVAEQARAGCRQPLERNATSSLDGMASRLLSPQTVLPTKR